MRRSQKSRVGVLTHLPVSETDGRVRPLYLSRSMTLQQQLAGEYRKLVTRRWFFKQCGVGLGAMALGDLLGAKPARAASLNPLAPKLPHFAAKAKRVIYLFMAGGPSHLELFDNKPELAKWDGKLPPADLLKGYRTAFISPNSKLLGPKFKFTPHGQC